MTNKEHKYIRSLYASGSGDTNSAAESESLTDDQIRRQTEDEILKGARSNKRELVRNPLFDAKYRGVQEDDDPDEFETRINQGIRGTGEEHRRNGGQQSHR